MSNNPGVQDRDLQAKMKPKGERYAGMTEDQLDEEARRLAKTKPKDKNKEWYERVKEMISRQLPKKIKDGAAALECLGTIFKTFGISGWIETETKVQVIGHVERMCSGTDKWVTIDLEVSSLALDGVDGIGDFVEKGGKVYLRVEVKKGPLARKVWETVNPCNWIDVNGQLRYDGDGWFEVHPVPDGSVTRVNSPIAEEFPKMDGSMASVAPVPPAENLARVPPAESL
jgi:hypothetical protein